MKILTAEQIREIDRYTIENEPVTSIDLMERAAAACAHRIMEIVPVSDTIHVFCGMGNNGGDGLAIARMLLKNNFNCRAYVVRFREQFSPDAQTNYERLKKENAGAICDVNSEDDLPQASGAAIDALLGTGATSKTSGILAEAIAFINKRYGTIISIDVPSGLFADADQQGQAVVRSTLTLTFHAPKLSFLLPENSEYVRRFEVLDIGLSAKAANDTETTKYYVTAADILPLLKERPRFSHKGMFGHALLLAGSAGKSGAALLSAAACLRSGAGLLTVHSTRDTLHALNIRLPEAMSSEDEHSDMITAVSHPERYHAVAFGPGTGTHDDTSVVLKKILQHGPEKLVIDADGLNILAENKTWLEFLPSACVLTPHPGEFARLVGKCDSDMERLDAMLQFSRRHNCILLLKGANTCVAMPDGNLFFNSTGNPALAKAGTGDALTGVILGLAASGYSMPQAALIGVFIHGLAADVCAERMAPESVLAGDVIDALPQAFALLKKKNRSD